MPHIESIRLNPLNRQLLPFIPTANNRDRPQRQRVERRLRALIGRDNVTVVEVRTAAPGRLDKVQLELTASGVTRNFTHLDGGSVFTTSFNDLTRGEPLQLQANVSAIDPSRVDVVTVDTTVARRPDLHVTGMSVAPHGYVGGPARVHAVIRERNGDTGARANCVLSVDGADVDRADGIWVDAGGTVSCTFAPRFTSAGDKRLVVRVESARPGDDDPTNDSGSALMRIYDDASDFAYWTGNAVDFPNVRVSLRETTDGQPIQETLDAPLQFFTRWAWGDDEPSQECAFGIDGQRTFEMCEVPAAGWFRGSYWIEIQRGAGDVTYRSIGWDRTYATNTPPGYSTWNSTYHDVYGAQKRLGSSVEFHLQVSDGTWLWEANGVVPLQRYESSYEQPRTCYTSYMGPSCWESYNRMVMNMGSAWGVPGE